LLKLLRGAGLFVMSNIRVAGDIEGFGVVMLEAGMCGLPTVAAGIEGIRDAIHDGRNGVLVPSGDPEAFAAAILGFHEDRAALAAASERARSFTKSAFAWPVIADQYVHALAGASAAAASRMSG
jgi:phosphatidylinositol alpha-1,6-mannosyltransferase